MTPHVFASSAGDVLSYGPALIWPPKSSVNLNPIRPVLAVWFRPTGFHARSHFAF